MSHYFENDNTFAKAFSDENGVKTKYEKIMLFLSAVNDKVKVFKLERWIAVGVWALFYFIRLIMTGGYHALTYCLGIHLLNAFIGFISPLEDPEEDGLDGGSFLPQKDSEEFRPFQRKVKEFQLWHVFFWSFYIGTILTFINSFNFPVYWPLLLVYFVLIFALTMRKQINHMIKYKYLPWDAGKAKYGVSLGKK